MTPALTILDGGMLTTVQDLGRTGAQRYGVPVAGAMDRFALRAANRLSGNGEGRAGLEMTVVGPEIRFEDARVFAVTGADLGPMLDGRSVPMWQSHVARPGSVLSFAGPRAGVRAYLAVSGGIDVPPVLGSRSTFTRSALGGFEGRALRAGDRVALAKVAAPVPGALRRVPPAALPPLCHSCDLRVVMGPQDDRFTDDGLATFLSAAYTVTPQSDRVGCRLSGPRVAHRAGADIVSDGSPFGAVQITGDGVPIILMADRGTTGGYTKIATIVSADLGRVAQASAGDAVRFVRIDLEQACELARQQARALDSIEPVPDVAGSIPVDVYDEDSGAALAADGYARLADAIGARGGRHASRSDVVRSAMPGLVVDVLVAAADDVSARQPLVTIEAMKMQNAVRAPRAGRIARVLVARGAVVEAGTPLVEFEPGGQVERSA